MDHIRKLSREQPVLNKGKDIGSALQMNSKSLAIEIQNNNSNIDQRTTELSPSKCQGVISNSDMAATSNRTLTSEVEIVATESKLGTADLMTSVL